MSLLSEVSSLDQDAGWCRDSRPEAEYDKIDVQGNDNDAQTSGCCTPDRQQAEVMHSLHICYTGTTSLPSQAVGVAFCH